MIPSTNSLNLQEKAARRIPGMTQLLSKRPDRFSLGVWPGYYSRCEGAKVWDLDGNEYLDMSISGIGTNILGYRDPDVDGAVAEAIARGVGCTLNCPEEVELAELLCELHPWADMVRYARSGGEAMAVAVRIARARTGRDVVAFCGYHGWHDWYLSANLGGSNGLCGHHISGLDPAGVPSGLAGTALPFRYNHLEELEAIVSRRKGELAAIIMEPIRNSLPGAGFLQGVRRLADEAGAVLIVDEISAGLRENTGGAHMKYFPEPPDMAVFAKALGNGYAMAAVIGKADAMEAAQKTFISSTNWTESLGPAAALATLRKHRAIDAGPHLTSLGEKIQEGWKTLSDKHGLDIEVGGMKPMGHFTFKAGKPQSMKAYFVQSMLDKGFLASNLYYAMAAHTLDHIHAYLQAVDLTFAELRDLLDRNGLDAALRGQPSAVGFGRLA